MSQNKLKALYKLLGEYEKDFKHQPSWTDGKSNPDTSQPLYGEVIRCIMAQIKREID